MQNEKLIERARSYMSKLDRSIEGANGSTAIFAAAVVPVKGFLLSDADSMELLREWNQAYSLPPWSDRELEVKIRNAHASSRPDGYLLRDDERGIPRLPSAPLPKPLPAPLTYSPEDLARREVLRKGWPKFKKLGLPAMKEIAALRMLPVEAVFAAVSLGYLHEAFVEDYQGRQRAFVIHDGFMAQARRFDGLPFTFADKTTAKNKTLPGSLAAGFLGKGHLGESSPVLVLEGCIGMLEGLAATFLAPEHLSMPWTILAAVTAGSAFRNDADLLQRMAGRRVRIIMDGDSTGASAAGKWTAELRAAGCTVDAVRLPPPAKDLGELIALGGDVMARTVAQIFTL